MAALGAGLSDPAASATDPAASAIPALVVTSVSNLTAGIDSPAREETVGQAYRRGQETRAERVPDAYCGELADLHGRPRGHAVSDAAQRPGGSGAERV